MSAFLLTANETLVVVHTQGLWYFRDEGSLQMHQWMQNRRHLREKESIKTGTSQKEGLLNLTRNTNNNNRLLSQYCVYVSFI